MLTRRPFMVFMSLLTATGLAGAARTTVAQVTQDPPEKVLSLMLEAVKKRSHDDFMAEGSDELRANLTKQMFEGVAGQMAPRLAKGYKTKYLTKLRKDDHAVHLWKLEIADGKDDVLVTMAIKDKKVAGIYLQ